MSLFQKSWFYLAAIFLAGLVAGAVLSAAVIHRQMLQPLQLDFIARQVEKELTNKLELDAGQRERVRPLIARTMEKINVIYVETLESIDRAIHEAQKSLVADLRPDQIEKLPTVAKDRKDFIRKHNPLSPPVETEAKKDAATDPAAR